MDDAEQYAGSRNNTLLWFTVSDLDFTSMETVKFVLSATIRSEMDTSAYGKMVVANITLIPDEYHISNIDVVTSLDNYTKGKHITDLNTLTPAFVDVSRFEFIPFVGFDDDDEESPEQASVIGASIELDDDTHSIHSLDIHTLT